MQLQGTAMTLDVVKWYLIRDVNTAVGLATSCKLQGSYDQRVGK